MQQRSAPLRVHLFLFALVCFIPPLLAIGLIGLDFAKKEQRRVEEEALRLATEFSLGIDSELRGLTRAVQALTTSPSIADGDFQRFREQAVTVAKDNAATIVLRNLEKRHLVSTLLPYGTEPMPVTSDPILLEADARALETRQPVLSNLYIGATGKRPYVTIVVPLPKSAPPVYLLSLAMTPERIADRLQLGPLADQKWLGAVLGSDARVIARTRDPDLYVGKSATGDLAEAMRTRSSGTLRSTTLDGVPVFTAFRRGDFGWTTVVSVPVAVLEAPVRRLVRVLLVLVGLAVVVTCGAAWAYGRLLGGDLEKLAGNARRMGRHAPLESFTSFVSEVGVVQKALEETDDKVEKLLRELDHRVKNNLAVIMSLASRTVSIATERASLAGRIAALANAHEALSRKRWARVSLHDLLKVTCSSPDISVAMNGPEIFLSPRGTTAISQAFHELCSNASEHGSQRDDPPSVEIVWDVEGERLRIYWKEKASFSPSDYQARFGLKLVQLCIVRQLNGELEIRPSPGEWLVEMKLPLDDDFWAEASSDTASLRKAEMESM